MNFSTDIVGKVQTSQSHMSACDLEVAIFSYNRPELLKTCLQSVRANIPGARVTIFDDGSDHPDMVAFLRSLPPDMVARPEPFSDRPRHGGLYANMQRAFEGATAPYLLMLQDDTQVVRALEPQDLADIDAIFQKDPRRAFLNVSFLRGSRRKRHHRLLSPTTDGLFDTRYSPDQAEYRDRIAYFDIALWHVSRLREKNWQTLPSEHANILQARDMFSSMPVLFAPFVFQLPEAPTIRHRRMTYASRLAQRLFGTTPKTFKQMSRDETDALRQRDPSHLPIAEDFLITLDPSVHRPFASKNVKRLWWLAALNKIEIVLRGH